MPEEFDNLDAETPQLPEPPDLDAEAEAVVPPEADVPDDEPVAMPDAQIPDDAAELVEPPDLDDADVVLDDPDIAAALEDLLTQDEPEDTPLAPERSIVGVSDNPADDQFVAEEPLFIDEEPQPGGGTLRTWRIELPEPIKAITVESSSSFTSSSGIPLSSSQISSASSEGCITLLKDMSVTFDPETCTITETKVFGCFSGLVEVF